MCGDSSDEIKAETDSVADDRSVTELLIAWNEGDDSALNQLIPIVMAELRRLAKYQMRGENADHTLQTTALINEVYLKLVGQTHAKWHNRSHFFSIASELMRRILVDYARRNLRSKRNSGIPNLPLDETLTLSEKKSEELISLDEALQRLAEVDPQKAKVVELRHFIGLSVEETAKALEVAEITVIRHWKLAKSWLRREVRGSNNLKGDSFQRPTARIIK